MLTIYSASAGTGKTHTLTGEYLSLLFKGKERHRHILAVTFTNKATAEMKSRIIEELFRLADDQSSDFLTLLSDDGKKREATIRMQANDILRTILHDYSAFHISTIDRFFQQTLRAFTREIGLQGNFQVELEPELMLEKTVDDMLAELEKSENATLMDWLLQFMEDKIDEGSGWNIRSPILKLSEQLFKETYQSHSDQIWEDIHQKHILFDYRNSLYLIIGSSKKTAQSLGEQGVRLMEQHGMQASDFRGGTTRSPFRIFQKLATGEIDAPSDAFFALVDNVEGYLAKKTTLQLRQAAVQIYENGMNELVRNVVSFFEQLTPYYTAREITKNFYALGILTDLSRHIAAWRKDNNKMLIADTTELLNKIIDGSEIPFIYEKTGVRIEHYMIDEFQDTSAMQWANFRPLLKDSLDSGRNNLIVGDVKQSIYRFRNSDWKLLDRQVKSDFAKQVNEVNLDVNWRSCHHIVKFNNMLFEALPTLLQQTYNVDVAESTLSAAEKERYQSSIVSAYRNADQHIAPPFMQHDGYVSIQFLVGDDRQTWVEQSMERLPHIVEQLQDNGYELRDMAILARTNTEGLNAAETLLKYKEAHPASPYKYDIISEDTLTVGASLSVRWIIAMVRYLNQPENKNYRELAQLAYATLKMKNQSPPPKGASPAATSSGSQLFQPVQPADTSSINAFIQPAQPADTSSLNAFIQPFRPEDVEKLAQLSHRSLYELAEGLFRLCEADFPDNELVYVQTFLDTVSTFVSTETADTGRFLAWWDEKGYKQKIVTPDSQNAIRIMTIHKSKGLGFKVVIMPFADWNIDQKPTILWCRPSQAPFNKLAIVPVGYNKKLRNTIFASDYFTEKLHAYIDNLNALYVAFTRAKEALIVVAPRPKNQLVTVASLLWDGLATDQQFVLDTETGLYERGDLSRAAARQAVSTHNEQVAVAELPVERIRSLSPDNRMLLRLRRHIGFDSDEKRKYGLLMHDLLSRIEKREDIARALSEKYMTGEINSDEAALLKEQLLALTAEKEVSNWFDGSMQVMNETGILFGNGQSARPDRIMIDKNNAVVIVDYKFGDQKERFHQRQLEGYVALIRAMGYQNVTGFLWYFTLHELEKCFF